MSHVIESTNHRQCSRTGTVRPSYGGYPGRLEEVRRKPVGVMSYSHIYPGNSLRSFAGADLEHLDFSRVEEDDEESKSRLERAEVVVCSSVSARRLPGLSLPEEVEVIVQDRTLSRGGVEMFGRLLRRSRAGGTRPLRPAR